MGCRYDQFGIDLSITLHIGSRHWIFSGQKTGRALTQGMPNTKPVQCGVQEKGQFLAFTLTGTTWKSRIVTRTLSPCGRLKSQREHSPYRHFVTFLFRRLDNGDTLRAMLDLIGGDATNRRLHDDPWCATCGVCVFFEGGRPHDCLQGHRICIVMGTVGGIRWVCNAMPKAMSKSSIVSKRHNLQFGSMTVFVLKQLKQQLSEGERVSKAKRVLITQPSTKNSMKRASKGERGSKLKRALITRPFTENGVKRASNTSTCCPIGSKSTCTRGMPDSRHRGGH